MTSREATLLAEMVAIPSVNPRSGSCVGGETLVARYIRDWAVGLGFDAELAEVEPGRSNVYVRIPGTLDGLVLLQSHTDTVEIDGMTVEPHRLSLVDGRWYGRGSCDAKGQLAAFMAAIERAVATGEHHSILLAGCIDEEEHYRGVTALCAHAAAADGEDVIGAVVGEPSELRCVVAHKGVLRGTITARGSGGHSSRPGDSPNPINELAEVISYLAGPVTDQLAKAHHPLLGSPTLAVTTIHGGDAINIIPRTVAVGYDRRTLPTEDPMAVWRELKSGIEDRWPVVTVDPPTLIDHGLDAAAGSNFIGRFGAAMHRSGLRFEPVGVPFGSDASKIARLGIDCVVFGAGSIDQAHTSDESVPDDELTTATAVIAELLCGQEKS